MALILCQPLTYRPSKAGWALSRYTVTITLSGSLFKVLVYYNSTKKLCFRLLGFCDGQRHSPSSSALFSDQYKIAQVNALSLMKTNFVVSLQCIQTYILLSRCNAYQCILLQLQLCSQLCHYNKVLCCADWNILHISAVVFQLWNDGGLPTISDVMQQWQSCHALDGVSSHLYLWQGAGLPTH